MIRDIEVDIANLAEKPLSLQWLILLAVFMFFQLVGYWWYLSDQLNTLQQLRQQESELRPAIQRGMEQVVDVPRLTAQLTQLSLQHEQLSRQLVAQHDVPQILALVNQQGLAHQLIFSKIDWGKPQALKFLERLPLNIELVGRYDDIGRFFQAMAELPYMLHVEEAQWERVSPDSQRLSLQIRAYTYQLKTENQDGS